MKMNKKQILTHYALVMLVLLAGNAVVAMDVAPVKEAETAKGKNTEDQRTLGEKAYFAMQLNDEKKFNEALNRGLNPNYINDNKIGLINSAPEGEIENYFLEQLLAHGADPNLIDKFGTPLGTAFRSIKLNPNYDLKKIVILLKAGADPNIPNSFGSLNMSLEEYANSSINIANRLGKSLEEENYKKAIKLLEDYNKKNLPLE